METKIQLFCFPYSGGKACAFNDIGSTLDASIEMHSIEYAGRGTRNRENYISDYNLFLQDIYSQIMSKRDPNIPFALFGYSIGAIFAYDLASREIIPGCLKHMFLGASSSPDFRDESYDFFSLSENEFWDKVISLGGVDGQLIKNKKFLKLFSNTLRADFNIGKQYKFQKNEKLITCNATIMYSENDTHYEEVSNWKALFNGDVDYVQFRGNHFFAFEDYNFTSKIIKEKLKGYYEN